MAAIAAAYGVTIEEIAHTNALPSDQPLEPGTQLLIPLSKATALTRVGGSRPWADRVD